MNRPGSRSDLESTLAELRSIVEEGFAPETAAPGFPPTAPSAGQCAAVSVIVRELLGGEFVSARLKGMSHWFNRIDLGGLQVDFDITGDQFGRKAIQVATAGTMYTDTRVRAAHDVNAETLARAIRLAERAGLKDVARGLRSRRPAESARLG